VEFLSQSPEKVAREIHYEAGLRLSLVNSEDRRDPFLGILLGDWYELRAGFITREYETTVWEVERRSVDGKWVEQNKRVFALDPYYFDFYDSFSTPVQGGHKSTGQEREFQKRTRRELLWWFFKRNAFAIVPRCMLVAGLIYLCSGGSTWVLNLLVRTMETAGTNNAKPPAMKTLDRPEVDETHAEPHSLPAPFVGAESAVREVSTSKAAPLPTDRATVVPVEAPPVAPIEVQRKVPPKEAKIVRPVKLALIARGLIALDDGRIVRIGEMYGSLQLEEVNLRTRECVFKGGLHVRLGDEIESK
jgi:hypothetical protein